MRHAAPRSAPLALTLNLSLALLAACGDKDAGDDGDGTGGAETDADGDGFSAGDDCDDSDPAIHPDAAEICDGVDNNCDELVDDEDPGVDLSTGGTFYTDADGDGHGDAEAAVQACVVPDGASEAGDDCDDTAADINPSATEVCDDADVDEDCSGDADDADPGVDPASQTTTYPDADGDGYGDASDPGTAACDPPSGVVGDHGDCDDADPAIHPDATEVCDALDVDEDCDGDADDADDSVDPATQGLGYPDTDGDGYGADSDAGALYCDLPSGVVADHTDCDDSDAGVSPAATEVCDGSDVDEDCDGNSDDDDASVDPATQTLGHVDDDGDGYGDATDAGALYCALPSGVVADGTDCDDGDAAIHPGATEICDGADNDCDASTSEAGMVTFTSASGVSSEATATFSGGTAATPMEVVLATAGTVSFCDDTFFVNLDVEADVTLEGVLGTEVLDGGGAGTVVAIETDAISVVIQDLTIQGGDADVTMAGYLAGGGVACAATAGLQLDQVHIRDSEGFLGGGLASDGCTVDLVDSEISDNAADFGGGMFAGNGDATLEGTAVELNTAASSGGGLYAWTGAVVDFGDGVIADNAAGYGGGVFIDQADVRCTGTGTAGAAILSNSSLEGGGGMRIGTGSAASLFTATLCDLGEAGALDDNADEDIYLADPGIPYVVGDGATFSCDDAACGTMLTSAVGGSRSSDAAVAFIKGNVFLADTHATLHGFRHRLGPDSTCVLDHYMLSSATGIGTWDVAWSQIGLTPTSIGTDWQESGDIDMLVESGTYYALVTGFRCTSAGQGVGYSYTNAATADDAGFGSHHASYNDPAYAAVLGATTSGASVGVGSGRARYRMEVDITEL